MAIPLAHLAENVVGVSNCSGRDIDKFARFKLATKPTRKVCAPLLPDCFVNLECKVVDAKLVNTFAVFLLETVAAWADPAQLGSKTLHHSG